MTRKTALITGASAGLGVDYARLFAKDGHDLVLVARRKDKLEEIGAELSKQHAGLKVTVIAADLSDPGAPVRIYEELAAQKIEIEFLVNNAGYGTSGKFAELDATRELEMIEVNIKALVHLSRLLVPGMIARGSGRILNIGSTAAFLAGPFMATYYASKAFVLSFTEALAHELAGTGVTATVSCPGATATEFAMVAKTDKSALFRSGVATSASVALDGYRAMLAGRKIAVAGWKNRLNVFATRFSPRSVTRGIAARMNRT